MRAPSFLLNGKPLFLKGVCKHEMIGDSGHVVSYEQIEEDMKMIKSTGSNFVRLVHYPHCKATLDIADKLGLMVSEEPGLWWSDTANEEVANGSLEVLKERYFATEITPLSFSGSPLANVSSQSSS